jgi:alkylation response protein AidB-like acyl-CoA dehydrogenase
MSDPRQSSRILRMTVLSADSRNVTRPLPFPVFLENLRETLAYVFHDRANIDRISTGRGLPPHVMREIQSCDPLSLFIPEEYGGRGSKAHEIQAVLEASAYELLGLGLTIGINGALFLQPVAKFGREEIREPIFRRFLEQKCLGGLMITEPDYGSDALNMRTHYTESRGHYRIRGTKHWGGLTGWADYWLVTARRRGKDDQLDRDIDFFVVDQSQADQLIEVEEYYPNFGLWMIPYGRNKLDIRVPEYHRLEPESTGIKMMLEVLHRSRMQFPGMSVGVLRRLMDDAMAHCKNRFVGGASLFSYDQVQERLARLQGAFTACSAMCAYTSENAGFDKDLSKESLTANSIKTISTDLMQEAAQSVLQLFGGQGFRLDNAIGRAAVDSRPFQIFEGSNDILYQQMSESVLKSMRRAKENNLYQYLKTTDMAEKASDFFKDVLNFEVDMRLPQRKMVELGRVLGRVFTTEHTLELGGRGFNSEMISNALNVLKSDVEQILSNYRAPALAPAVEDYGDSSSLLDFVCDQKS